MTKPLDIFRMPDDPTDAQMEQIRIARNCQQSGTIQAFLLIRPTGSTDVVTFSEYYETARDVALADHAVVIGLYA